MADLWEQKFKPIHSSDHQTYGFQQHQKVRAIHLCKAWHNKSHKYLLLSPGKFIIINIDIIVQVIRAFAFLPFSCSNSFPWLMQQHLYLCQLLLVDFHDLIFSGQDYSCNSFSSCCLSKYVGASPQSQLCKPCLRIEQVLYRHVHNVIFCLNNKLVYTPDLIWLIEGRVVWIFASFSPSQFQ